ncbi:hypothetical protein PLICRDRAFT_174832 [Plicaturopsis crispa FD-325 SS-3]|nr:hypothetical protein PLICRDRAFT_174832 [Plicaturopsis crispa FD-325 SS-3]
MLESGASSILSATEMGTPSRSLSINASSLLILFLLVVVHVANDVPRNTADPPPATLQGVFCYLFSLNTTRHTAPAPAPQPTPATTPTTGADACTPAPSEPSPALPITLERPASAPTPSASRSQTPQPPYPRLKPGPSVHAAVHARPAPLIALSRRKCGTSAFASARRAPTRPPTPRTIQQHRARVPTRRVRRGAYSEAAHPAPTLELDRQRPTAARIDDGARRAWDGNGDAGRQCPGEEDAAGTGAAGPSAAGARARGERDGKRQADQRCDEGGELRDGSPVLVVPIPSSRLPPLLHASMAEARDRREEGIADRERLESDTARIGHGEGARVATVSWIWSGADDAQVLDALRVEWAKAWSRARRWDEEVQLVKEEMRRVLITLEHRAEQWAQRREGGGIWRFSAMWSDIRSDRPSDQDIGEDEREEEEAVDEGPRTMEEEFMQDAYEIPV